MTAHERIGQVLTYFRSLLGEEIFGRLVKHYLTRENVVGLIDGLLDFFEVYAATTATRIDDMLAKQIRTALQIPDGDDDEEPS